MTGLFPPDSKDAIYLTRRDPEELLGTYSQHTILLDEHVWPTAEHYFQAMHFASLEEQALIRNSESPADARRLGEPGWIARLFRPIRKDWPNVRVAFMTRAVYTKCKTYPEIEQRLIATGSKRIIESDQYDYFWGCGRDLRGDNMYGKILMNVRDKLNAEANP